MILRGLWLALLTASSAISLTAQTTLSVTAASLRIDPAATDSYTLSGTFSGLNFGAAQSVTLEVGPYAGTIPIGSFTAAGSTLTYTDATGQTPYWVSSLTIDTQAQTFTAHASGVVLAGVENPFAVQLGTDTASGCSMARVSGPANARELEPRFGFPPRKRPGPATYALTAGDGMNEPCEFADAPIVEPPVIAAGAPATVTITAEGSPTASLPAGLQVFMADGNAQPTGAALCTLAQASNGSYSCTATFNQATAGTFPLVIQAKAGAATILSPGFSVQAVGTVGTAEQEEFQNIQNTMQQTVQNFQKYGYTAYATILTLEALRTLMHPPAGLTGQPVELCPDGLSIGVRSSAGVMVIDYLINDLAPSSAASGDAMAEQRSRIAKRWRTAAPGASAPVRKQQAPAPASSPLQCGQFQHDIVENDAVLLWDPGQLFFGAADQGPLIVQPLMASACPPFGSQLTHLAGAQATRAAMATFPNYATIVMATHGDIDSNHRSLIITGEMSGTTVPNYADGAQVGISCFPYGQPFYLLNIPIYPNFGCFFHVYANYITAQTEGLMTNSIIYAALCFSASGDMAAAFTPLGSNNAYYGFDGPSTTGDTANIGKSIFTSLAQQYQSTSIAYISAPPPVYSTAPLDFYGDRNLAYVGNPQLVFPQEASSPTPLALTPGSQVNMTAKLDGISECGGTVNYSWVNSAVAGHLMPSAGGPEDDFTNTDPDATYTASNTTQAVDNVVVQFLPNPSGPAAAMACSATDVTTQQILHVVFNGSGTWNEIAFGNEYTADWSWQASWDLTLATGGVGLPGSATGLSLGQSFERALPGTLVTGETIADAPNVNDVCEGPPVLNPTHNGVTTLLPQSPYLGALYPSPPAGSTLIPMWVETFGGDDFSLCGTGGLPTVGDYPPQAPGYPSWDTSAGIVKFDLDLSQWVNKPSQTMSMPVSANYTPVAGGYDSGTGTQVTGTLTFTSRTAVAPSGTGSMVKK
jgi:hypothetical protein